MRVLGFVSGRFRTFALLFWLIGLLQAALVIARDRSLDKFQSWGVTQYYMNYLDFSFVKRGLVGTLLHPVFTRIGADVDLAKIVILLLDALLFIALVLALDRSTKAVLRDDGVLAKLVRTAIVVSPVGVMQYSYDPGRFDHINFALIALATALLLNRRNLAAGAVVAIGVLVHEAVFVYAFPLLVAMALALGSGTWEARARSVVLFGIVPLAAAVSVALFGNTDVNPAAVLPPTVLQGAEVWQRGVLEPATSYSPLQLALLAFYVVAPYVLLWHFYRANGIRVDLVFAAALSPIALFVLGIDYFRWCQLVFVAVLGALFFHASRGRGMLELPGSALAKMALVAYLLPLGPIGVVQPFPFIDSFARNALGW